MLNMKSKKIVIELASDDFNESEMSELMDFVKEKTKKYIKDKMEDSNIAVDIREENDDKNKITDPVFPSSPYPAYPINPCYPPAYPPYMYKEGDLPDSFPPYKVTCDSDKSSDVSFSVINKNSSK